MICYLRSSTVLYCICNSLKFSVLFLIPFSPIPYTTLRLSVIVTAFCLPYRPATRGCCVYGRRSRDIHPH